MLKDVPSERSKMFTQRKKFKIVYMFIDTQTSWDGNEYWFWYSVDIRYFFCPLSLSDCNLTSFDSVFWQIKNYFLVKSSAFRWAGLAIKVLTEVTKNTW